ncbi:MAG: minichromosome maintenance protein MCM [Thermoplasmata archaeon]|nr:minichromosome maintenance protein MCM [Thermoplasmata archaeon]MCI4361578.1 minichromosome maintenance protein MCM [Thermoplasmata archaeon]
MVTAARTLVERIDLVGRWTAVLEEGELRPRILELADRFPEERSLEVPFSVIESADTPLADLLLERPEEVIAAGARAMRELIPAAGPETEGLRLRVIGLPSTAKKQIRMIREADLNQFVALDGIVRKATEVRPQIREAVFSCLACRAEVREPQDDGSTVFREPLECPTSQGGCGKPAGRTRFRLLPEKSTYIDSQRIEIQENPETLKGGAHPQGLSVLLTEDLTGQVTPGNRVVANGVLKSMQRATASRAGIVRSTTFDLMLHGNSLEYKQREYDEIEISEAEERTILAFRGDPTVVDKVVLSLAPTIKGMEEEKEAIALQLFGGVEKRHADGIRIRGDIHVLLVGDPGTAKSQLLRYIADVAPRGIYTSGKGATAAGLTAAAVKDDFAGGRWVLEAGMLVLADGGMAIVDELDKMTPEDRSAMHEALEQQTVSIAKAGITATLNARCPVLAAANPKWGRFNPDKTIAEQLDLPPTLLSRFDVIYSIKDRPEEKRDRFLANRILLSHQQGAAMAAMTKDSPLPPWEGAPFPPDLLRKYIAYARRNIRPVLSNESLRILEDFYVRVRKQGEEPDAPVPITARQLEALVRLSEAAARARLSLVVSAEDAQRATRIVEGFLARVTTTEGKMDIDAIATGVTHNQRERVEKLQDLMRELQEAGGGTFDLSLLHTEAEKRGIAPNRVDALFSMLRNQGEIAETRPGRWQLIRF